MTKKKSPTNKDIVHTTDTVLDDADKILRNLISSNQYGTFFGVSQKVLDDVWNALTAGQGDSVTYISMEIGADLDVFHPVNNKLVKLGVREHADKRIDQFIKQFLNGPVKIPNYGGGLGILAGDTLKSLADCQIPTIAVSLLYRKGYFSQLVDSKIGQVAWASSWDPENTPGLYLLKDPNKKNKPLAIEVPFKAKNGGVVIAQAHLWLKMEISEGLDFFVPEILLDYHTDKSPDWIKEASQHLYDSSSEKVKATQRRLLGAGVLPTMRALGITSKTIHLNEQHGVAVVLSMINEKLQALHGKNFAKKTSDDDILAVTKEVAEHIVYTIHTPVKAGHDRFGASVYKELVDDFCQRVLNLLARDTDNPSVYNFTAMAMNINRATNSVSRLHRDVTQTQFPQFADKIAAITNGVHHLTWTSDAKAELYDTFGELNNWRQDPSVFADAKSMLTNKKFRTYFEQASQADTQTLISYINEMLINHRNQRLQTWIDPPNYLSYLDGGDSFLDHKAFTIGFARRFSTYKRADLIFEDIDTLAEIIVSNNWPTNFIYAGKAHPSDEPGKELIRNVLSVQEELYKKSNGLAKLVFIPGYDMQIAKMMVAGVHVWLNSPKRPLEASGTSGMKAAMNGIPNFSIMDGWWVEGYHDGQTGWKFGYEDPIAHEHLSETPSSLLYEEDSVSFYKTLPKVLESFYEPTQHDDYVDKCIMNLILNCPIFNTHRMAAEYVQRYNVKLPKAVQQNIHKLQDLYNSNN